jgi:hypothetical protein
MRIDFYTKAILTGIFFCLAWLCVVLTPIGTRVEAQVGPTQVVIAGYQVRGDLIGMDRGLPVQVLGQAPPSAAAQPTSAVPAQPAAQPVISQPAATAPATTSPTGARQQCAATTQRGARCSRLAQSGSAFCWQHAR